MRGEAVANAIKVLEELDREFPKVPDYRYELSETYAMLDINLRTPQLRREAESRFKRAVDLAADLARRFPNVPEYQASLARSQRKYGTVLRGGGKLDDAERAFRQSVNADRSLVERFPLVPDYLMFLAESQLSLGELLKDRNRLTEAKTVLGDAIVHQNEFLKSNDQNIYARRLLANQYQAMADTLSRSGNKSEAQEMSNRAKEIRDQLYKEGRG